MRKYALVIGVSRYEDPDISDLQYAAEDAREVGECLRKICGFNEVRTLVSGGEREPDHISVVEALHSFAPVLNKDDLFLFYFAGHGIHTANGSFLLASNSRIRMLELTAVPMPLLQQCLSRLDATERVLILDACRNDPYQGRGDSDNLLTPTFSRDIVAAAGASAEGISPATCVLFACSEGERAYEWPDRKHGIFTWFLLEGLRGAAADSEGGITIQSLGRFVEKEVPRCCRKLDLPRCQTPWAQQVGSLREISLSISDTNAQINRRDPIQVATVTPQRRTGSDPEASQQRRKARKQEASPDVAPAEPWKKQAFLRRIDRLARDAESGKITLGCAEAKVPLPRLIAWAKRYADEFMKVCGPLAYVYVGVFERVLSIGATASRALALDAAANFQFDSTKIDAPLDPASVCPAGDIVEKAIAVAFLRKDVETARSLLSEALEKSDNVPQLAFAARAYHLVLDDAGRAKSLWADAEAAAAKCRDFYALLTNCFEPYDAQTTRRLLEKAGAAAADPFEIMGVAELWVRLLRDVNKALQCLEKARKLPKKTWPFRYIDLVEAIVDATGDIGTATGVLNEASCIGQWDECDTIDDTRDYARAFKSLLGNPERGLELLAQAEVLLRREGRYLHVLNWSRLAAAWYEIGNTEKAIAAFREAGKYVKKESDIDSIREALEECGAAKAWKAESFLPRKKSFLEKMMDLWADQDS